MSNPQASQNSPDKFRWYPSPNDPSHYLRPACGVEAFFKDTRNRFATGEDILFVGLSIRLQQPLPPADLVQHARDAWLLLRQSVPTIACVAEAEPSGRSHLSYYAPRDGAAAISWAERTVILHPTNSTTLDDLRQKLGPVQLPDQNNDQTFLHIIPRSDSSYDVLLHSHHSTLDGPGVCVLLTLYLKKLAQVISAPQTSLKETFSWGSEVKRLLPASDTVLDPNEAREGPQFDQTLMSILSDMAMGFSHQRGIKANVNCGIGPNRRATYRFSEDESAQLIASAKSKGITINNWLHGALSLICIEDNPLSETDDEKANIVYYGVYNARARLASPFNSPHGYPGYCIAFSFLTFPFSVAHPVYEGESQVDRLFRAATVIQKEIRKQKHYPSFLAVHPTQTEIMLASVQPDSEPPPPRTCPDYIADGVVERYLDREYRDLEGNCVITIEDYFLSVNRAGFAPIFRAWTWRDRLVLSADYNGLSVTEEKVNGLIDKLAVSARILLDNKL